MLVKNVKYFCSFIKISTLQKRNLNMTFNRPDTDKLHELIDKYSFEKYYVVSIEFLKDLIRTSQLNKRSLEQCLCFLAVHY